MNKTVFLLLCLSVWLNYVDRGALGVAAPVLAPELELPPFQMGVLLSAFFWTYSLLQPIGGLLVDRLDVYRVYAAGLAVWSLGAAAGGLANGFVSLLVARLLIGIGEAVAFPTYSKLLTTGFREDQRGFANAMIDIGTKAGPAVGTFAGGLLVNYWGWRWFFFFLGGVSLLWLIPWLKSIPPVTPRATVTQRPAEPPTAILRLPAAWVTFFGLFCFNYAFYFLLTWLPTYLVRERKFSLTAMSILGALPFAVTALASLGTGALADRLIRQKVADGVTVRRRFAVLGLLVAAAFLPSAAVLEIKPAMVCLMIAFAGIGIFTANCWAITQSLAGPERAGMWTGWQNAVGNMGGVVAPILTGWSVQRTGSFWLAFAIASGMLVASALLYGVLLPPAARRRD
jgi:MFS transporter, ACS family, D-galactonate transporter